MDAHFLLHNQSSSHASKLFKLADGTFFLGRSLDCHLVVIDESVSRRHAEITVSDGCVRVRDLESRNGTYVNDRRIGECVVNPGDHLRFGNLTFTLVTPDLDIQQLRPEEETPRCGNAKQNFEFDKGEFSTAECRVLDLLLIGLSEKEIAAQLHLSQHTVHNHVRAIYRIVDVHTRAELLARFIRKHND
jgi:DNA-binding CsgD family transcriptional regulator